VTNELVPEDLENEPAHEIIDEATGEEVSMGPERDPAIFKGKARATEKTESFEAEVSPDRISVDSKILLKLLETF
jgi:hypothetical protein